MSPPPPSNDFHKPRFGPAISSERLPLVPQRRFFLLLSALFGGPHSASPTAAASARKAARSSSRSSATPLRQARGRRDQHERCRGQTAARHSPTLEQRSR